MSTLTFDINDFIEKLKEAGFSPEQAKAHAEALVKIQTELHAQTRDAQNTLSDEQFVTKEYLESRLKELEKKIDNKIDKIITIFTSEMKFYFLLITFVIIVSNTIANPKVFELIGKIFSVIIKNHYGIIHAITNL